MRRQAGVGTLIMATVLSGFLAEKAAGAFVASDNFSLAAAAPATNQALRCESLGLLYLCFRSDSYTSDSNSKLVAASGMGMSGVGSSAGSSSSLLLLSVAYGAVSSAVLIVWRALFLESASSLWLPSQVFHPPRAIVDS